METSKKARAHCEGEKGGGEEGEGFERGGRIDN